MTIVNVLQTAGATDAENSGVDLRRELPDADHR